MGVNADNYYNFSKNIDSNALFLTPLMKENLSDEDIARLQNYKLYWDFYDGYHWDSIPDEDKPQVTENYCRAFVNKFVAFELSKGFNIKVNSEDIDSDIDAEVKTPITDFLNEVWKDNKKLKFCVNLGQEKSITGNGWIQIKYEAPGDFDDPFNEHPKGRIGVRAIPSMVVFPEYDPHDTEKLVKVTIMYPINVEQPRMFNIGSPKLTQVIYKQVYTKDRIQVIQDDVTLVDIPNKYKVIPFVHIANFPEIGKTEGLSDLTDVVPLNVELNLKKSDISEIIDYYSAPVTVVYGASIENLQRGANKIWGGLPKDGKIENLELKSDLVAANNYVDALKQTMHEVSNVPSGALGGEQAISNTSGVALQFVNMPLIDRTRIKRMCTEEGLELTNKIILLMGKMENLITMPKDMTPKDFYSNEVSFPDTLPKDTLIELQEIQMEMKQGLENRIGAMQRLGKENIPKYIKAIDKDMEEHPLVYGINPVQANNVKNVEDYPGGSNSTNNTTQPGGNLNSGLTNGTTPIEQVRKEITGQNMGLGKK